jgi:hypothetical protein
MLKLYHLTTYEELKMIAKHGAGRSEPPKYCADGELGRGFYLHSMPPYDGKNVILVVSVDVREYAYIPYPKSPNTETREGKLFRDLAFDNRGMMLGDGVSAMESRVVGTRIRNEFLRHGYRGIMTDSGIFVVFDASTAKLVR